MYADELAVERLGSKTLRQIVDRHAPTLRTMQFPLVAWLEAAMDEGLENPDAPMPGLVVATEAGPLMLCPLVTDGYRSVYIHLEEEPHTANSNYRRGGIMDEHMLAYLNLALGG